ncbi:MAG: hypothetical protein HYV75_09595 [Opitutae bacterium]|nr:hypothetical protein [Opitutae bacterium]
MLGIALTGCVTSKKYRLAKKDTPPAQAFGWQASVPGADLTLQTVIVFKGPGSWQRAVSRTFRPRAMTPGSWRSSATPTGRNTGKRE